MSLIDHTAFLMNGWIRRFVRGIGGRNWLTSPGGYDPLGPKIINPSVQGEMAGGAENARPGKIIVLAPLRLRRETPRQQDYELLPNLIRISESIPATRDNRIYLVDASAFFCQGPGPRIVDSLELLAGILQSGTVFQEFARQIVLLRNVSSGGDDPNSGLETDAPP